MEGKLTFLLCNSAPPLTMMECCHLYRPWATRNPLGDWVSDSATSLLRCVMDRIVNIINPNSSQVGIMTWHPWKYIFYTYRWIWGSLTWNIILNISWQCHNEFFSENCQDLAVLTFLFSHQYGYQQSQTSQSWADVDYYYCLQAIRLRQRSLQLDQFPTSLRPQVLNVYIV